MIFSPEQRDLSSQETLSNLQFKVSRAASLSLLIVSMLVRKRVKITLQKVICSFQAIKPLQLLPGHFKLLLLQCAENNFFVCFSLVDGLFRASICIIFFLFLSLTIQLYEWRNAVVLFNKSRFQVKALKLFILQSAGKLTLCGKKCEH